MIGHWPLKVRGVKKLKIAMSAPPWIQLPAHGYGGTENVIHYLTRELVKMGVEVHLFTVGDTVTPSHDKFYYYKQGQYAHGSSATWYGSAVQSTQVLYMMNKVSRAGDYDIIHDHNKFFGPTALAYADPRDFPPALYTLHDPFGFEHAAAKDRPDNKPFYELFADVKQLYFNGISEAQLKLAPPQLKTRLVGAVHNGIDPADFPFVAKKDDYFITLGEFRADKGWAVAAQVCEELGLKLRMAGPVSGINKPRQLLVELASVNSPYRGKPGFTYFRDHILPLLAPGHIEYVGTVAGEQKLSFISRAKAFLFPIQWDEPFGMVVIEALACGTPVVAMRRGSMPEIIQHGVNGFLADNYEEFREYVTRVDEIDPAKCRESVEKNFSARVMAEKYLAAYQDIIARHS